MSEVKHSREMKYSRSPGVKTLVNLPSFFEMYAQLIGCQVNVWKYITHPVLFLKLRYGQLMPIQYRLHGPHSNESEAISVILKRPIAFSYRECIHYLRRSLWEMFHSYATLNHISHFSTYSSSSLSKFLYKTA